MFLKYYIIEHFSALELLFTKKVILQYLIERAFRRFTYDVISFNYSNQPTKCFEQLAKSPRKIRKGKKNRLGHVIHSPLYLRSSTSKNNTLQTEPLVYSSKSLFKLPP